MATEGDGWAVANIEELGDGPGFRKVRKELGVTAFGVNAIEFPPHYEAGRHFHDEQEELYFVHRGRVEIDLRRRHDAASSGPGGLARWTRRPYARSRNPGDEPALAV